MRDQRSSPRGIGYRPLGRFVQHPSQIAVRIKAVFLRGLDQTEHHGAALRSVGRVCKEKVLPGDYKGLDAALSPVVAELNAAVLQVNDQGLPLVLQAWTLAQRSGYLPMPTLRLKQAFPAPAAASFSLPEEGL